VIIKPEIGSGALHTAFARTEAEVVAVFDRASTHGGDDIRMVIESPIVGRGPVDLVADYVSVETISTRGKRCHLGITGKLPQLAPFRETGQFWPAVLAPSEAEHVIRLTEAALAALRIDEGVTHTELKLTVAGPRIVEVNLRIGGYINELYSRVLGVDIVEVVTRAACGEAPGRLQAKKSGVHFQYTHQPPLDTAECIAIDGGVSALKATGMTGFSRLGIGPLPGTPRTFDLDLMCGWAPTITDMERVLTEAHSALTFTFRTGSGSIIACSGRELAEQTRSPV